MLRVWMILTAVSVLSLIAASCAQTAATAVAVDEATAAEQAATIASTEIYDNLANTAAQMTNGAVSMTQPSAGAPNIPGFTMIETPDSWIMVKGNTVIIMNKSQWYGYTGGHSNPDR